MTPPPCYGCGVKAAGNPTWPASAFCESCQPIDTRPVHAGANACAAGCGEQFGTLRDFDRAQRVDYSKPRAVECIDPAEFGDLVRSANQVWLTASGLANRALAGERLRAAREAHRPL
jgi:hypothetical protein